MNGLEDVNDLEKGVEWGNYMMLQVAEGADPATVAASINDAMMGDVQAWARDDIPDNLQFQHKGRIQQSSLFLVKFNSVKIWAQHCVTSVQTNHKPDQKSI